MTPTFPTGGELLLVLTLTGLIGTGCALLLARTLGREGRCLVRAAAAVGTVDAAWRGPLPRTAELAAVAVQLQRTAHDLHEARRAQNAAEQSRQELATWMSHDLLTPLAGIRAMAEALEDEMVADPHDVQRYHRQMRVDAERLTSMVNDLFELSRLQSGRPVDRSEAVDVVRLAQDVVVGCQALEPARPLILRAAAPSLMVTMGAQDLARALRNLVVNALRYSPADAPIDVHVGERDGQVVVEVCDRCGGIPDADLDRLFDVGFRGSTARTPDARAGAGLGLAITSGLVQAHSGQVSVRAVPGGCCFTIALPRRNDDAPALPGPLGQDIHRVAL